MKGLSVGFKHKIASIFAFFILLSPLFSYAQTNVSFTRSLSVGSQGEDVRQLQKILNSRPETRITDSGPGSFGQETTYFGELTKKAVIRFQELHKDTILVPQGLSQGTGYVGPSTLNTLRALIAISYPQTQISSKSPTNPDLTMDVPSNDVGLSPTNPNTENLDMFVAQVDDLAVQRGYSEKERTRIKNRIILDAATTTDLRKKFIETVEQSIISKVPSPFASIVARIVAPLKTAFLAKPARAAGVPFGGSIIYTYYCSCSQNWLIGLRPTGPTFATPLSYYPGTQAFLSHNIPFTTWLLGEYTAGAGICVSEPGADCAVTIPSAGLITPLVGSSGI